MNANLGVNELNVMLSSDDIRMLAEQDKLDGFVWRAAHDD